MLKLAKIGVVGAGNMGSGIAQKIAQEGYEVILNDVSKDILNRAVANIDETLQEGVKRKVFSEDKAKQVVSLIHTSPDLSTMAECQLIIEAVIEDITVKKEVFKKLDDICPLETVFATNTSTLSVGEMAIVTKRPDRFIGLHFFFHPAKNALLELIFTKETCQEAIDVANFLSNIMGKTPIVVRDSPGFAVNRFFIPWSNEAIRLLDEGLGDIPSIDHVVKETVNIGMGPFEFMNATRAFSLAYHTPTILSQRISEFYGPAAGIQAKFKSGEPWDLSGDPNPAMFQKIQDRLLGVVFLVTAQLVDGCGHND
jgi:enoyl-CoA hydratase/3-hydroxyacyl-CoA dehydrogenase